VCRLVVILFVRRRHNVQEKTKTFFDVSLVYFFVVSSDDQTYGVQDTSVQPVLHVVFKKLGAKALGRFAAFADNVVEPVVVVGVKKIAKNAFRPMCGWTRHAIQK